MDLEKLVISAPQLNQGPVCELVLSQLNDWFGIPEANQNYRQATDELPTLVARLDSEIVGFVAIKFHFATSAELYVLGVLPGYHRSGIGKRMILNAENYMRQSGVTLVQVKTLSASADSEPYARTRKFYEALGYEPFEEFLELWDPHNPALQMVKRL